jgi:hypothetical protein
MVYPRPQTQRSAGSPPEIPPSHDKCHRTRYQRLREKRPTVVAARNAQAGVSTEMMAGGTSYPQGEVGKAITWRRGREAERQAHRAWEEYR